MLSKQIITLFIFNLTTLAYCSEKKPTDGINTDLPIDLPDGGFFKGDSSRYFENPDKESSVDLYVSFCNLDTCPETLKKNYVPFSCDNKSCKSHGALIHPTFFSKKSTAKIVADYLKEINAHPKQRITVDCRFGKDKVTGLNRRLINLMLHNAKRLFKR